MNNFLKNLSIWSFVTNIMSCYCYNNYWGEDGTTYVTKLAKLNQWIGVVCYVGGPKDIKLRKEETRECV